MSPGIAFLSTEITVAAANLANLKLARLLVSLRSESGIGNREESCSHSATGHQSYLPGTHSCVAAHPGTRLPADGTHRPYSRIGDGGHRSPPRRRLGHTECGRTSHSCVGSPRRHSALVVAVRWMRAGAAHICSRVQLQDRRPTTAPTSTKRCEGSAKNKVDPLLVPLAVRAGMDVSSGAETIVP
jgi:hypothetical protein